MATDLGFEATELRLGLPGGGGEGEGRSSSSKRGFSETIDLKLKLEPAAAAVAEEEDPEAAHKGDVAAAPGKMKRSPSQSSVVTAEKQRAPKYVSCAHSSRLCSV
jgi:auxin-responsive protein IAA